MSLRSGLPLELEDLPFPSTLRAVDQGEPGAYISVNRAFLELYGMTEAPVDPAAFMGEAARGPDEMDRRVADHAETVNYDLRFRGRRMKLDKSPVLRDGVVVGVLTSMTNQGWLDEELLGPAHLGMIADASPESITLLEIVGIEARVVSQNQASVAFDRFLDLDSIRSETADQARSDLFEMAMESIRRGAPFVADLPVADRHFEVRSEMISDPGVEPWLVTQTMVDVTDRARSDWLTQLIQIAGSTSVSDAATLSFDVVERVLGFDRAALVRFDGHVIDIISSAVDVAAEHRVLVDPAFVSALDPASVVRLAPGTDSALRRALGITVGAAIPVSGDTELWGCLVIGHSRPHANELTVLNTSMLESLGSTLGILIQRDEARQNLQESNRRLEAYAHAAAHDLRSPLRRIRSFSQILQARLGVEELDREQLADFAERIANGAGRLDALLESMLVHASISTLARESDEYADLGVVARAICDGISELSLDPRPTFVIGDLPVVRLPHDAAERVLRNLIDNALKYSSADRPAVIEITSEAFDDGVRVRVSDNGIGIEPQYAGKIFELFNQLSSTTSGSGVGLAVVERLLSARGAKIWVESEIGRGATFVIEFPVSALQPSDG